MNPILIVDYDPSWPAIFATERAGDRSAARRSGRGDPPHRQHVRCLALRQAEDRHRCVLRSDALIPEAIERMQRGRIYTFHGDPYGDGMWTSPPAAAPTAPGSISAARQPRRTSSACSSATGCAAHPRRRRRIRRAEAPAGVAQPAGDWEVLHRRQVGIRGEDRWEWPRARRWVCRRLSW